MRQVYLCPSCGHRVAVMRRGALTFCAREQRLTSPRLLCRRFQPHHDPDPEAVREGERERSLHGQTR